MENELQFERGILAREKLRDLLTGKITDIDMRADLFVRLQEARQYMRPVLFRACILWAAGYVPVINDDELRSAWIQLGAYMDYSDVAFIRMYAKRNNISETGVLKAYARLLALKPQTRL